jgi:hypothetical protein
MFAPTIATVDPWWKLFITIGRALVLTLRGQRELGLENLAALISAPSNLSRLNKGIHGGTGSIPVRSTKPSFPVWIPASS